MNIKKYSNIIVVCVMIILSLGIIKIDNTMKIKDNSITVFNSFFNEKVKNTLTDSNFASEDIISIIPFERTYLTAKSKRKNNFFTANKLNKKIKIVLKKSTAEEIKLAQEKAAKEGKKLGIKEYFEIPESLSSETRTYMHASSITCKSSDQWALFHDGKHTVTKDKKGLVLVDGRYAIALGSYYCNEIGMKIDLKLADGTVINCILGDQKADKDTDPTHRFHTIDKSVVEFIVADDYESNNTGTINWAHKWTAKVKSISILGLSKGQSTKRVTAAEQEALAKQKEVAVNKAKELMKKAEKKLTLKAYEKVKKKVDSLETSGEKTELLDKLKKLKKKVNKAEKQRTKKKENQKNNNKKDDTKTDNSSTKDTPISNTEKPTASTVEKPTEKETEIVTEKESENQTERETKKDTID